MSGRPVRRPRTFPASVDPAPTGGDVEGLGFPFVEGDDRTVPNPVGPDDVYEGLCPPYYPDMRAAVEAFVERKFGPEGAYDPGTPSPGRTAPRSSGASARTATRWGLPERDRPVRVRRAREVPGTIPTMVLPGYVQAHRIDTAYYDANYPPGAYRKTHANHFERWHYGENER